MVTTFMVYLKPAAVAEGWNMDRVGDDDYCRAVCEMEYKRFRTMVQYMVNKGTPIIIRETNSGGMEISTQEGTEVRLMLVSDEVTASSQQRIRRLFETARNNG